MGQNQNQNLTTREVAELLSCSEQNVRKLCRSGRIRAHFHQRLGRWIIHRTAVEAWLDERIGPMGDSQNR